MNKEICLYLIPGHLAKNNQNNTQNYYKSQIHSHFYHQ